MKKIVRTTRIREICEDRSVSLSIRPNTSHSVCQVRTLVTGKKVKIELKYKKTLTIKS